MEQVWGLLNQSGCQERCAESVNGDEKAPSSLGSELEVNVCPKRHRFQKVGIHKIFEPWYVHGLQMIKLEL